MASYVSAADFDAICGERQLLFADGGVYDSTHFDAAVALASSMAQSRAKRAGYAVGDTTTEDVVVHLTMAYLLRFAYGRKQRSLPEDLAAAFPVPEGDIGSGDFPLDDVEPDPQDAVGGVKFSDSSSTTTTGRPPVMKNLRDVY